MTAYTRPSVPADIGAIAENLRQADKDEIQAASGKAPSLALACSYMASKPCMTLVSRHGNQMGMWGVVPDGKYPDAGRIWLLGTDDMVRDSANRMRFLREARHHLDAMGQRYEVLFNFMDARNVVHRRWLQWLGFTFIAEHPNFGAEGRLFLEFCKVSSNV